MGRESEKNPKWAPRQRVEIDYYELTHGITAAVSHYQGQYSQIKKQKQKASCKKQKGDIRKEVGKIAPKKSVRPKLLLGKIIGKTITPNEALKLKGAPVNANLIITVAKGIIMVNDCALLAEHGDYFFNKK